VGRAGFGRFKTALLRQGTSVGKVKMGQ